jgi:kynurenine formamidase
MTPTHRLLIDLSHTVTDGMATYPGIPGPTVGTHLSRAASRPNYAPGTEFHFGLLTMVGNTGTYLDAPFHRYADGTDLADLPLERTADLDAVVVTATDTAVDASALRGYHVAGRAVLVHTGWSRHWGTDHYATGHPHLTEGAAAWLVEQGAVLVGIDSLNIDGTDDGTRPVHSTLLAAGIPVVEHLTNLALLPGEGFRFHAAPLAVHGMGTVSVRAYAVVGG